MHNRRTFFKAAGLGCTTAFLSGNLAGCSPQQDENQSELKLGMASYTLRKFTLEQAVEMTTRLGLAYISLKSMHMPLDSSSDEIKTMAAKVRNANLNLYGCGVVYMKTSEQVDQAFDYAKQAGMRTIIGVPEHDLLDKVNDKVQEYDIKLAIHNHGPGDERYPTAASAYEKIKDMDARMGLCMDIGHSTRAGENPSKAALAFADRLHDVHIKDVSKAAKDGETVIVGRGVIDIPNFLDTLLSINYQGVVALEYEAEATDPLAGCAESIGFERGVLSVI